MKIHIVQEGETLWDLAQKYNVPKERIIEQNPSVTGDTLKVGSKIKIPVGRIPLVNRKAKQESTNTLNNDKEKVFEEDVKKKEQFTEKVSKNAESKDVKKEKSEVKEKKQNDQLPFPPYPFYNPYLNVFYNPYLQNSMPYHISWYNYPEYINPYFLNAFSNFYDCGCGSFDETLHSYPFSVNYFRPPMF